MHQSLVPPDRTTRMVYAAVPMGVGRDCDWTATPGMGFCRFRGAAICRACRLEFAAFSVKSMFHDIRG